LFVSLKINSNSEVNVPWQSSPSTTPSILHFLPCTPAPILSLPRSLSIIPVLPLQSAPPPFPLAQSCDITTFGVTGGGAEAIIESIDSIADQRLAYWCPHKTLALVRSNHPLDSACREETLQLLQQYCRQPVETVCVRHPEIELLGVTTKELRDLISFSSPINDTIITCYLEKLTRHYSISYMTTAMVYILRRQGWDRMKTYFALHRNRPRTNTRPILQESQLLFFHALWMTATG
jgi:hypothetical protein